MARFGTAVLPVFLVIVTQVYSQQGGGDPEDPNNPHRDPSKCEVCKIVAKELQGMMDDTGKTREVLHVGHRFDKEPKKIPYKFSELRFIEATESVCDRIMEYNIHAERDSSRRFSKGTSETMKTLEGLKNKGVKVDLGIPENMWNEPSAPVHTLKKYCEKIVEEHEESIEAWYKGDQEKTLIDYMCRDRVLTRAEAGCLEEEWTGVEKVEHKNKEENEISKGNSNRGENEAELDSQKIQREIERQAEQQQQQREGDDKETERNRRKREREIERRQREREGL